MDIWVGRDADLNVWVGKTIADVERIIEDDCGGYLLSKETRGDDFTVLQWFVDSDADTIPIYITREKI